jgi:hypothetical protein
MIATYLNKKGILSDFSMGVWFLYGLPLYVRSKVVRKKKVDTKDADIVKYKEIYEYVEELVESDEIVQKIDIEIEPDLARKEELRELVDRY